MNKHGVRRLIALSTASSKDPNDKPGIKLKAMIALVKTGYPGRDELGTPVSRAVLADFMLKQVEDTKYIRQALIITN